MVNSNENAIREAAYFLWQNNGCPSGRDQEFWAMAVDQLNSKSSCKSSQKNLAQALKSQRLLPAKQQQRKKLLPQKNLNNFS